MPSLHLCVCDSVIQASPIHRIAQELLSTKCVSSKPSVLLFSRTAVCFKLLQMWSQITPFPIRARSLHPSTRFTVPSVRSALAYPNKTRGAARTATELISAQGEHHVGYLPLTSCSLQLRLLRQSLLVDRHCRHSHRTEAARAGNNVFSPVQPSYGSVWTSMAPKNFSIPTPCAESHSESMALINWFFTSVTVIH